jgi:hypothetical protein
MGDSMSTIINATTTNGVVIQPDNSGSLVLQTNNGTTALTIDTSQNITTTNKLAVASMPTGSVVQVVNATYSTAVTNNTNTYADTGLSATITPSSSSSKILVFVNHADVFKSTNDTSAQMRLLRNSTSLIVFSYVGGGTGTTATNVVETGTTYLDSPSTTSAVTYKTQFLSNGNNATVTVQFGSVASSTITLMEIKG